MKYHFLIMNYGHGNRFEVRAIEAKTKNEACDTLEGEIHNLTEWIIAKPSELRALSAMIKEILK